MVTLNNLVFYPSPNSLSYAWNSGSFLGIVLFLQILTGLCLTLFYTSTSADAFSSLQTILENSSWAFLIQSIHLNGASLFFFIIYFHIVNSIIYNSYLNVLPWTVGVTILILSILIAFIGYVLPFGNISFWAATVITNLLSVIPFNGEEVVIWLWGNFYFSDLCLNIFFTLHFLLPFLLFLLVFLHLFFLHQTGSSSNATGNNYNETSPFSMFIINDLVSLSILTFFVIGCLLIPYYFADDDSYNEADILSSPIHITPEWYFLFAFSILRAFPSNIGGVIALCLSVCLLFFLPYSSNEINTNNLWAYCVSLICIFIFLTYIGTNPAVFPYRHFSNLFSLLYFFNLYNFTN